MSAGAGAGGGPDRVVVIGVGNPFRGDDGIGPAVLGALRSLTPPEAATAAIRSVDLCELDGEPARLVETWHGAAMAVVIDAIRTGAAPGTVRRFELGFDELPPGSRAASSHAIGVAEAVDLGRALDRLPDRLVVFGIEGGDFGTGSGLSEAVAATIDRVATAVRDEVSAAVAGHADPTEDRPCASR